MWDHGSATLEERRTNSLPFHPHHCLHQSTVLWTAVTFRTRPTLLVLLKIRPVCKHIETPHTFFNVSLIVLMCTNTMSLFTFFSCVLSIKSMYLPCNSTSTASAFLYTWLWVCHKPIINEILALRLVIIGLWHTQNQWCGNLDRKPMRWCYWPIFDSQSVSSKNVTQKSNAIYFCVIEIAAELFIVCCVLIMIKYDITPL